MALIIGDIHGCLKQLNDLLEFTSPPTDQVIVTLGDYIDRGENTKGVIDRLLDLSASHKLVHLKGNHDVFMEEARYSQAQLEFWLNPLIGGQETLDSYNGSLDNVPASHWSFLENAILYYELDDYICVHGGVDAKLPLLGQSPQTLLNLRFHKAQPHVSGKVVICGHTRQMDGTPKLENQTLCIDTNVFDGGYLTAFNTETKVFYQVNAIGERKSFHL